MFLGTYLYFLRLNIDFNTEYTFAEAERFTKHCFNWSSNDQREIYKSELTKTLVNIKFDFENIDDTYDKIVASLQNNAEKYVKKRKYKKYLKPYWSPVLEKLHKSMVMDKNRLSEKWRSILNIQNWKKTIQMWTKTS